jgi:tetratricopeptide (TPR) repeat protein
MVEIDQRAGLAFPAPFKLTTEVRGPTAEMLRAAAAAGNKDQLNDMIDSMANQQIPRVPSIVYSRSMKYDAATSAVLITAAGIVWNDWSSDDGRRKLALDSTVDGLNFTPDRTRTIWRDYPVTSGAPNDSSQRTTILLPAGGAGFALEGDQTLPESLGGVMLKRSAALGGGSVTLEDRVTAGILEIQPAEVPAARRLVTQAKSRRLKLLAPAGQPAPWREAVAGKASNAFAPVLAAFAGYIADKPDDSARYLSRSSFLQSIFDWQGALRDTTKAVTLDGSANNYVARAGLRTTMGDDKGAMEDLRAAVKAEPGSGTAVRSLALELSRRGKLDEGLALLDDLNDDSDDHRYTVQTRATMLSENGQAEEAVTLLDDLIKAKPGDASLLNSRCWLKGTANIALDTGLKDCARSIELSEDPSAALDSRAMIYFRMERYDDALADLNAALDKSPGQAASLFLRGVVLKRMGKSGDDDFAAARMISPRIDVDYARWGIKP